MSTSLLRSAGLRAGLLMLLSQGASLHAQTPDWTWAQKIGTNRNEAGQQLLTDGQGNVYLLGTFEGPNVVVGPYTFTNVPPAGNPFTATFLLKYDTDGVLLWGKGFKSPVMELALLCFDGQGNLYVRTNCYAAATVEQCSLTPGSGGAQYLLKYAPDGHLLWAKPQGAGSFSTELTRLSAMAALDDTRLAVAGSSWDDEVAGEDLVQTYWLATMDTAGTFEQLLPLDGIGPDLPVSPYRAMIDNVGLGVTTDGRILLLGDADHDPDLNTANWDLAIDPQNGTMQSFIAQFDGELQFLGSTVVHGSNFVRRTSFALDQAGNLFWVGVAQQGTLHVDDTHTIELAAINNAVLTKYSPMGEQAWSVVFQALDPGNTSPEVQVRTDALGNVHVAGSFNRTDVDGETIYSAGNRGIFVAKYDTEGTYQWHRQHGQGAAVMLGGFAESGDGELFVCGRYASDASGPGPIAFGTTTLPLTTGSGPNIGDLFFAKLGDCVPVVPTIMPDGEVELCAGASLTLTGSDHTQYLWSTQEQTSSIEVTEGGTYSLLGADTLGCYGRSGEVYVDLITVDTDVVQNNTTLTAEAVDAAYQWLSCAGAVPTPIAGADEQSFTPTINGSYAVAITENGCTDTSACITVIVDHTGIADAAAGPVYSILAGPAPGTFGVRSGDVQSFSVEVMDMAGRRCAAPRTVRPGGTEHFQGLVPGAYAVQVYRLDGERSARTLVVVE